MKDYSHTIDFKSPQEQKTFWGSFVKYTVDKTSYIRRKEPFLRVNKKLDDVQDINYLYYIAEEGSKTYFCKVINKEYVNEEVTHIFFENDVLQTYMFDYKLQQSYVLQEHCDRWDANHKPIYSRTDEGLDYGQEFTVESAYKIALENDDITGWYLALCTPHNELVSEGQASEPAQTLYTTNPYVMYLLPNGWGPDIKYIQDPSTSTPTTVAVSGIQIFMEEMSKSELGQFVQQIIRIPYLPFNFAKGTGENGQIVFDTTKDDNILLGVTKLNGGGSYLCIRQFFDDRITKNLAEMGIFEGIESAMPTTEQWAEVKVNPYNIERDRRFESKLLTYPYRYNLFSNWKSEPLIIKNEYIGGDKIKVNYSQGMTFNGPARYWVEDYKKDVEGRVNSLMELIQEDVAIVNDAYYSYMLANRNQIEANKTNAVINTVANTAQSLVGGAIFGGGVGAVSSAVNGAFSGAVNYQNMIRSENAKQRDLKNMPDTIINSNSCNFNISDKNLYITFYRMKICCEFEEMLADTFAMTGYTVKRVKIPNTKSRLRFNYVKTVGANITGSFDQEDLAMIKAIFDNGITFWHYNTVNFKPFDYSLENIETKLI